MSSAGFYLYKAEQGPLPGDQIDIAGLIARRPAPRHDDVTLAAQVEAGSVLALDASHQMRGKIRGSAAPLGHPVQPGQRLKELGLISEMTADSSSARFIDAGSIHAFVATEPSVAAKSPDRALSAGIELRIDLGAGVVLTLTRR